MAASYADPVDVQRRGDSPTAFCWRGRVYLVQGVLAHWLETGPWWQSASVRALLTAADERQSPTTRSADQGQREFWQVEAAAGRHATPGIYELCADWTTGTPGTWSVTTVTHRGSP